MTFEQAQLKVQEQARKLGGGWRMEQERIPVVVLTTVEAETVLDRIENPQQNDLLGVKWTDKDGCVKFIHPNEVTLIYSTDGI